VIDTRDLVAMRADAVAHQVCDAGTTAGVLPASRRSAFDASGVFSESTIASEVPIQPLTAATRLVAVAGRAIEPDEQLPRVTYLLARPSVLRDAANSQSSAAGP
jgi:hypothetical protein